MRINKYVAQASGLSRRTADKAILDGRVKVNGVVAETGHAVIQGEVVTLDDRSITPPVKTTLIMLNKPVNYVCSRDGQGSKTVYDLLPVELHSLKTVGRLDKDSSGLLLLTNDGKLANELTHPSYKKEKVYEIEIHKPLTGEDRKKIQVGIKIEDYISRLRLATNENWKMGNGNCSWIVSMSMGRNRQIRRTFSALGYSITKLHRIKFGEYELVDLKPGKYKIISG